MNALIKKEKRFILLLLQTTGKQKKAMIKTITVSQMKAVVQIVYNVLQGYGKLTDGNKTKLRKHKIIIRRFLSKGLSNEKRQSLLLNYLHVLILPFRAVEKEL
ncbi:MAG: hypothetical protein ABW185_11045 [Sedimenticola sp.]